jgi:gliding motility-associated-like protein
MPDNICVGVVKHYYVDPNLVLGSTYVWRIDGIIQTSSTANAIDITWETAGTFLLDVQERSLLGCLGMIRTGTVSVNTVPIIVATSNSPVCQGSSIFLKIQNISGDVFSWTGPNGYSSSDQNAEIVSASPSDAGTYSLIVSNNGCNSVSSSVIIAINNCDNVDFNIPEGFSPNADGINDLFVIRGIDRYPNNKIIFFNRWGNKVFDANPYKNTWDGKATKGYRFGADELPIGTYFYVLDLGDSSPIIKGTIYLNR